MIERDNLRYLSKSACPAVWAGNSSNGQGEIRNFRLKRKSVNR